MTTQEILKLNLKELEKLTPQELRRNVSVLRSTSRKRYERVVESDLYSPSVESLRKSTTQEIFIPVRGLTDEQLINEFKRYRQFLKNPTSTVKGSRLANEKLREETKKAVSGNKGLTSSMEQWTTDEWLHYYALVDMARDTGVGMNVKYNVVKDIVEEVFDKRKSNRRDTKEENKRFNRSVLKEVEKRLKDYYEKENTPSAVYPSKSIT